MLYSSPHPHPFPSIQCIASSMCRCAFTRVLVTTWNNTVFWILWGSSHRVEHRHSKILLELQNTKKNWVYYHGYRPLSRFHQSFPIRFPLPWPPLSWASFNLTEFQCFLLWFLPTTKYLKDIQPISDFLCSNIII